MLKIQLEGSNRAHGAGISANSEMGLARKLIEAGYPDQPFESFRGDMKCMSYKSLAWAAAHTIREEPVLRVEKYKKLRHKNLKHGTATGTHGTATGIRKQQETNENL